MYTENEYIELKSELTKDIKKEIIAFANAKGGTIRSKTILLEMINENIISKEGSGKNTYYILK